MKIIVRFVGNTAIDLILLVYFLYTGSILFIMSIGAKLDCDRLEIGYVMCEQDIKLIRSLFYQKNDFISSSRCLCRRKRVVFKD